MPGKYHGPGRTVPESTTAQNGFLHEKDGVQNNLEFLSLDSKVRHSTAVSTAAAPGETLLIDGSASAVTVTLPSAAAAVLIPVATARRITIVNIGASHTVTVAVAGGNKLNGTTSADTTMTTQYTSKMTVDTDGTDWFKVA